MPWFSYSARDTNGQPVEGVLEAEDERDLRVRLREAGFYVIAYEVVPSPVPRRGLLEPRVTLEDLTTFSFQLAEMINAGIPITQALRAVREQTLNRSLKRIITEVEKDVERGLSLSGAMARHPHVFSRMYVGLVQTGEVGGVLDVVLTRLAQYLDRELSTRRKVRSTYIYPAFVLTFATLVLSFLLVFVVPLFERLYGRLGAQLPLLTRGLLTISRFVRGHWPVLLIGLGLVILVIVRGRRIPGVRPLLDRMMVRLPVFGAFLKKVIISRFVYALGMLLQGGVPILQALDTSAEAADNVVLLEAAQAMRTMIQEGHSIDHSMERTGFFPPLVVQLVATGQQTGALDQSLLRAGEFLDRDIDYTIRRLTAFLEPALTVFVGVVVGFFLVSLYLPVFNLLRVLSRR
ncbi:MAG: type II secretion system F family protein [Armatimonadota bacterium]|nr:type II secretion system F family protein [Armatimonadota bacterium]MDR5703744.1 type II secretion system F family protein [Armatimonadota bacterium]